MANQQISDYVNTAKAHITRMETAVTGIAGDITSLNDKIAALQNTPPVLTAEDQALLDEIQEMSAALASRVEEIDSLTAPVEPIA